MGRLRGDRSVVFWCAVLALVLSSCRVDWPTWGFGVQRQGYNPFESTIGPANVAQLRHLWSVDLGATINASPIVATDIDVAGTPTDLVYTETEHGELFAVKTTGQILWQRSLGVIQTNCPDTPDKQFGVSAPVVFDRGGNRVFVAGGDGYVYALEAATASRCRIGPSSSRPTRCTRSCSRRRPSMKTGSTSRSPVTAMRGPTTGASWRSTPRTARR